MVSTTTASGAASSGRVRPTGVVGASRRSSASRTASTPTVAVGGVLVALAAGGPLVVARGEEHLHRRVGEHDGPDVAPLDDAAAVLARPRPAAGRRAPRAPRGCAETVETAAVTSGPRISALTSRPSSRTTPSLELDAGAARATAAHRVAVVEVDAGFERGRA